MTEYSTQICGDCGLEKNIPIETRNTHFTLNQPLWVGYSRVNRFRKILKLLFFPGAHGSVPGKVFLIMKQKGPFDSVSEMCDFLKSLKSRTKNYNAIHLYAKYFVKNYVAPKPPLLNIRQHMLADFSLLERGMSLHFPDRRFFSYRWLLIKLLQKYELFCYVPFVKPLVNKISSKKYDQMFQKIMSANKHVVVLDIPRDSEPQLALPLGDDLLSQALLYASKHLAISDLHLRSVREYCRKGRSLLDSSDQSGFHTAGGSASRQHAVRHQCP